MDPLLASWTLALGSRPEVVDAGTDLLARYDEPHRRYHDRRHLAEVLAALRQLGDGADAAPPVVCAAWFHDAVHDGRDDDEQRSADLATRVLAGLSVPPDVVVEVARLVVLTRTHDPAPGDGAGALLSDADLAVLGADRVRYDRYATDVRREYAHVDDAAFRAGRVSVLRDLLERPRLYVTDAAHRRWDEAAKRNLRREISLLEGASADAAPRP